jgi:hypothetical protein
MGILDGALDRAKKFGERLNEGQTARVIKDTAAIESEFAAEASRIGVDTNRLKDDTIDDETADSIYDVLIDAYNAARNKDFDEYNLRTSVPLEPDSLKAATEKVINWNKRYKETVNRTFRKFWDYGAKLKRLEKENKDLFGCETDESGRSQLNENMVKIEAMIRIFDAVDRTVRTIVGKAEYNLTITENNLAEDLRKSISESYSGD